MPCLRQYMYNVFASKIRLWHFICAITKAWKQYDLSHSKCHNVAIAQKKIALVYCDLLQILHNLSSRFSLQYRPQIKCHSLIRCSFGLVPRPEAVVRCQLRPPEAHSRYSFMAHSEMLFLIFFPEASNLFIRSFQDKLVPVMLHWKSKLIKPSWPL